MRIYDNGGKTWDRYTVIPDPHKLHDVYMSGGVHKMTECLGLSDNCDQPTGFSQWSECQPGTHLGKLVRNLEWLPENVQKHIKERLSPTTN